VRAAETVWSKLYSELHRVVLLALRRERREVRLQRTSLQQWANLWAVSTAIEKAWQSVCRTLPLPVLVVPRERTSAGRMRK
jgi:hypothetical protein